MTIGALGVQVDTGPALGRCIALVLGLELIQEVLVGQILDARISA
jgi:hypothetical protein